MAKLNKDKKEWFTSRDVLWYLVFVGFAVNYMIRINLNIAIVSMVKKRPTSNVTLSSECIIPEKESKIESPIINPNYSHPHEDITVTTVLPKSILTTKPLPTQEQINEKASGSFLWNEYHKGLILGAFYWLHWLTQIPGGILAQKYGTKLVFGLSNFTGVLCCFAIPIAAYWGYQYLIFVRVFQGLISGFAWPSMHNMTARWIPPNERSKFVTAYLGSSIGTALTYPLCGWIIDKWSWELVFYVTGVMGSLWYLMWYIFVFDSPMDHPRISQSEKEYIASSLGQSVAKEKAPVPWKDVLTSVPVWMNILAQWGGIWGLFTVMTYAPTYFKVIFGWNTTATGLLSGIPHMLRVIFAVIFSQLGDYLLRSNKMSRTNVRKLATVMCCILQGILMFGLAQSGCNSTAAIIFLSTSTAANGAVSTGPLASLVDISPNYASICLGMCNTIVAVVGFLIPAVVSFFIYQGQTVEQWQKVYWIASLMLIVTGVLYVIFAKSELQPWNSPKKQNKNVLESELKCLNGTDKRADENIVHENSSPPPAPDERKLNENV